MTDNTVTQLSVNIDLALENNKEIELQKIDNGETPLHLAAKEGKILTASCLIYEGWKIDDKTTEGLIAKDYAILSGNDFMVEFLNEIIG